MKRNSYSVLSILLLFFVMVGLASCKKSGDNEVSFSWIYKGANYSAAYLYVVSSADVNGNFLAGIGNFYPPRYGMTGKIYPLEKGTITIAPRSMNGNWISFTNNDGRKGECSGTVILTSVVNNKISGYFNLTADFGGVQSEIITGTIKNVPITQ